MHVVVTVILLLMIQLLTNNIIANIIKFLYEIIPVYY